MTAAKLLSYVSAPLIAVHTGRVGAQSISMVQRCPGNILVVSVYNAINDY